MLGRQFAACRATPKGKASKSFRLKYMWGNNIRVRKAAVMLLGHDLFIDGIDEKGIHYNESGSKCTRTLDIIGAPAVTLKQNHADTRKRVTIMTFVSNEERAAKRRRKLPLELLFQSKTAKTKSKVLRNAKLPKDLDMSATVGPKGSYREEHVVAYLERWLQPWSEERQAAGDWRLLYMDAYKAHLTDRIQELCWPRGYVCLYHYGLTTGIAQVNDTDLHGEFSRIFSGVRTGLLRAAAAGRSFGHFAYASAGYRRCRRHLAGHRPHPGFGWSRPGRLGQRSGRHRGLEDQP